MKPAMYIVMIPYENHTEIIPLRPIAKLKGMDTSNIREKKDRI